MSQYYSRASQVASQIPAILENRGLPPLFNRFVYTERGQNAWLIAYLDQSRIKRIEKYVSPDLIHQISTALGGLPVIISNSTGLRYAILVSPRPALPGMVHFPGWQQGTILLGQGKRGPVGTSWPQFGHAIIAGMTRLGKSNTLRLVALQAIHEGHQLIIVDPDSSTFPDLTGHPQVLQYSQSPGQAPQAVEAALEAYSSRMVQNRTQKAAGAPPAPPQPMARLVVIIDEYNGLVLAHGGPRSLFAQNIISLAYGGLKFGIHLVIAGHEFTRDLVGPIAGQMATRVCLPVRAPSIARVVVGRSGPERVKSPGRALTDPWGWVQIYRLDYEDFEALVEIDRGDGLNENERQLVKAIREQNQNRVTYDFLTGQGLTQSQARRLRADWLSRGLVVKAPHEDNTLILAGL